MTRTVVTRTWALASLCAAMLALPAHAGCQLTRLASLDVAINPNGTVLVPLQINGHDVWMALNMASGLPMVGPQTLDMLGLKPYGVGNKNIFSNGARVSHQTRADSLRMGTAEFKDYALYVQPGAGRSPLFYQGRPLVGTLATVFLNVVDVELDLANHKLNLFKQSFCNGGQIYWGGEYASEPLYDDDSGLLFFPMELDGKRVETSLNTLGQRSLLGGKVAHDFFGAEAGSDSNVTLADTNGGQTTYPVRRMSLTARGVAVPDLPILIQPNRGGVRCIPTTNRESGGIGFQGCYSIVPMELGTAVLSQLRLYIATKERRIYFTRAGQPATDEGKTP